MTFRRRLVVFLFVFSLVPIAIMQVYTFVFYVPSISNKIKVLIDYSLQQKKENIRLMLRDNVDIIYQIAGDPSIAETIRSLSGSEAGIEALQESRLIEVFSQLCIFHSSLAGIGYIRNDGRLVEYDKYLMARDATSFDRLFPLRRIMETVDEQGGLRFFPTTVFRDNAGLPKNLFLVAFPYVDVAFRVKKGYLFLLIEEESLRAILNPPESDATGILTRSILYDGAGRLYSAPEDRFFGNSDEGPGGRPFLSPASLAKALPEFRGKTVNVATVPGPFAGWTVGTVYDESSVFSDRNIIAIYTLVIGLFFLALSGGAISVMSRSLFRSFSQWMENVRIEDARIDIDPAERGQDEFDVMGTAWARMRDRVSELVGEVNGRNASLLSLAEDRRLAEIRSLEAQVNPHFLYNTLNTLNWMAIGEGQTVLSRALSDLADIMRYSISQIDVAATMKDERDWLDKYLSLQKLRFGGNLESRIEDGGVDSGFRLYKLLFQPFVENALVHGFAPNEPGQLLEITFAMSEQRRLRATIKDNGRGFDVGKLRETDFDSTIGISNAERRLRTYYGEEASLTYASRPGEGTVVRLEVPEVRS